MIIPSVHNLYSNNVARAAPPLRGRYDAPRRATRALRRSRYIQLV